MPHSNLNFLRSKTSRFQVVENIVKRKGPDLLLRNGRVVNVYTREIITADVGIYGDRIGFVGDASSFGPAKTVIDVAGRYVTPGLLDGHLHIDSCMVNVTNFAKGVLPLGTTAVFIDSHEIGNVLGIDGVRMMVNEGKSTPLRVFQYVPAQVPAGSPENQTPNARIGVPETKELYWEENVIGLGEVSKYRVLALDPMFTEKIGWVLQQGGVVDGSAHDFTGYDLQAYVASGIYADHESVTEDIALERARNGLVVMLREGTTEHNVERCIKAVLRGADQSRFCFCSDDRHPTDIVATGHINYCIKLAVRQGLDPITAITMATLNCARNFGVDRELGGIAPGKLADILIVPDLVEFEPDMVIVGGVVVAESGKFLVDLAKPTYPESFLNSIRIPRPITKDDFEIVPPAGLGPSDEVEVRVIEAIEGRIWSRAVEERLPLKDGRLYASPEKDVCKIAVVERFGKTPGPNIGLGLIRGFGFKSGAIAESLAQDKHDIVVAGVDDEDMAAAVNELARMQGGLVVVKGGKILGSFGLPIGGIMSDEPIQVVADAVIRLSKIASQELGCTMKNPFACLQFQTHPMIPYLKVSDKGLMDVNAQKLTSIFK